MSESRASSLETEIFEIIGNAGEARGLLYDSLTAHREGRHDEGDRLFRESEVKLRNAHRVQAALVRQDLSTGVQISLLLIHAQDQLMTTMSEQTLIRELIQTTKELGELRRSISSLTSG